MEQNTPEKVHCRAVHCTGIRAEGEEEGKGEEEEGQTMEESEKIREARGEGLTHDSGCCFHFTNTQGSPNTCLAFIEVRCFFVLFFLQIP